MSPNKTRRDKSLEGAEKAPRQYLTFEQGRTMPQWDPLLRHFAKSKTSSAISHGSKMTRSYNYPSVVCTPEVTRAFLCNYGPNSTTRSQSGRIVMSPSRWKLAQILHCNYVCPLCRFNKGQWNERSILRTLTYLYSNRWRLRVKSSDR